MCVVPDFLSRLIPFFLYFGYPYNIDRINLLVQSSVEPFLKYTDYLRPVLVDSEVVLVVEIGESDREHPQAAQPVVLFLHVGSIADHPAPIGRYAFQATLRARGSFRDLR